MPLKPLPSLLLRDTSSLRRTLLMALPAWVVCSVARAQDAPRLRFRTRRAVCACAGDTDDEAIERAAEKLRGRPVPDSRPEARAGVNAPGAPATEAASQVPSKPAQSEVPAKNDKPTTRRQTP